MMCVSGGLGDQMGRRSGAGECVRRVTRAPLCHTPWSEVMQFVSAPGAYAERHSTACPLVTVQATWTLVRRCEPVRQVAATARDCCCHFAASCRSSRDAGGEEGMRRGGAGRLTAAATTAPLSFMPAEEANTHGVRLLLVYTG